MPVRRSPEMRIRGLERHFFKLFRWESIKNTKKNEILHCFFKKII